jgi:succinate dehydrogenase/fumarate reductase cytochrome b subunit
LGSWIEPIQRVDPKNENTSQLPDWYFFVGAIPGFVQTAASQSAFHHLTLTAQVIVFDAPATAIAGFHVAGGAQIVVVDTAATGVSEAAERQRH